MRVLLMGRSPFLVRGLLGELADHGVDVVGTTRSVAEIATALPGSGADVALACLPGDSEDVRPCVRALVSVMAEHPAVALLLLASAPSRTWLGGVSRWERLAIETASTEAVLASLVRLVAMTSAAPARHTAAMLTGGERRVLELLATGLSNDGIAVQLGVSAKTVETHVSSVFGKLGLDSGDHRTNRRVVAALRWVGA